MKTKNKRPKKSTRCPWPTNLFTFYEPKIFWDIIKTLKKKGVKHESK